jgi:uncharacterized protein
MAFPTVTAGYGALFALIYVGLSVWVSGGRATFRVIHGDGGSERLARRIRAHANFAEYVPFILLLAALLEASGSDRFTMNALLFPLLIARIVHPFGIVAPENSRQQFLCRAPGAAVTWLVLIAIAILLLARFS